MVLLILVQRGTWTGRLLKNEYIIFHSAASTIASPPPPLHFIIIPTAILPCDLCPSLTMKTLSLSLPPPLPPPGGGCRRPCPPSRPGSCSRRRRRRSSSSRCRRGRGRPQGAEGALREKEGAALSEGAHRRQGQAPEALRAQAGRRRSVRGSEEDQEEPSPDPQVRGQLRGPLRWPRGIARSYRGVQSRPSPSQEIRCHRRGAQRNQTVR